MTTKNAAEGRDYEARHLLVLEGLEAVRKRPAMYIGSTDTRGLMHCLWEIIDNAVDEALAGFGSSIDVRLEADGSITLGGLKGANPAKGVAADDTLEARLEAQHDWFLENAGLEINI